MKKCIIITDYIFFFNLVLGQDVAAESGQGDKVQC